jgi:hypothetical protein
MLAKGAENERPINYGIPFKINKYYSDDVTIIVDEG